MMVTTTILARDLARTTARVAELEQLALAAAELVDEQNARIDEWKTAHADLLRVLAHVREAIQRGLYVDAVRLVEPYVAWDEDGYTREVTR
jgi:hypothetical protein